MIDRRRFLRRLRFLRLREPEDMPRIRRAESVLRSAAASREALLMPAC